MLLTPWILFHSLAALFGALALRWLASAPSGRRLVRGVAMYAVATAVLASGVAATLQELGAFSFVAFAGGVLFAHAPVLLAAAAWSLHPRPASRVAATGALLLATTGVYAYGVEPLRLQSNLHTIVVDELEAPLRIVLMADLQTDRIGDHEKRALQMAADADPDLVLWTGDYLQVLDPAELPTLKAELNAALDAVDLKPRLGTFAVEGDVDDDHGTDWRALFAERDWTLLGETTTLQVGPLQLTGLHPRDSRTHPPPIPDREGFHVVFGHDPRFVLAESSLDLALAGHTHGGQVVIPGFGPLMTLTTIPRDWAAGGLVELPRGGRLIVSRGIGMERNEAPRLRFFCPPEVVVVDLVPRRGG